MRPAPPVHDKEIDRTARNASWNFDPSSASAVGLCRSVARQIMVESWGLGGHGSLADDAVLIVSELVTNVHRHVGRHRATITLGRSGRSLSIRVRDASPALPEPRPEPKEGSSGWDWTGWGLALVEAMAAGYGGRLRSAPDPDGHGKTVEVSLPLPEHGTSKCAALPNAPADPPAVPS